MKRFLSLMVAVVFAVTCVGAAMAAEQKAAPAGPAKAVPAADNTVKKPAADNTVKKAEEPKPAKSETPPAAPKK
jgi:PBP1b-binding outer membrane lipoprotein LpoB